MLAEAGIDAFGTPEACAEAVRATLAWTPPSIEVKIAAPRHAVDEALKVDTGNVFGVCEARAVSEALSITPAPTRFVTNAEAAPAAAATIGFPAAVKVVSLDLPHKTETDGVMLGVDDGVDVNAAI